MQELTARLVGQAISRVDGREKVMGRVVYAGGRLGAGDGVRVLVQSAIARGRIVRLETKGGAGDGRAGGGVYA